ncbi:MAG: uroporphyrinogen decarboxylase family protein [Halanaerobiaceae bacterium]
MTGKVLIEKVFAGEEVETIPWVPFAGVHAGKLKDFTAKEVLQDGDRLFASLLEVNKIYRPDGMPVIFDLQIEAETLGCELKWAEDTPPTVSSHPLAEEDEIFDKIPKKNEGRIPMVISVMEKIKEEIGDETALYGLICGPFTLASHLRGTNLFMDMITNPDYVIRLLEYTNKIAKTMAGYYIEAGMDLIAAVDPMVSQISPDHLSQFLKKSYTGLFECIRERGAISSFFVCGNAANNIEEMCLTEPDGISVDENVSLAEAKSITDRYDLVIGGNIPLTTVMLLGNQQDNIKCVIDLIDEVKSSRNLIISPGCDMPYDVPLENVIAVEQAVHETGQARKMIENYEADKSGIEVELPDYENLDKPLIEVFTLDSDTCAACTYMMEAAYDAQKHFGDKIDLVEYKYTSPENIARINRMGVPNLPSLYVNGKIKFRSIVPNRQELFEVIEDAISGKKAE